MTLRFSLYFWLIFEGLHPQILVLVDRLLSIKWVKVLSQCYTNMGKYDRDLYTNISTWGLWHWVQQERGSGWRIKFQKLPGIKKESSMIWFMLLYFEVFSHAFVFSLPRNSSIFWKNSNCQAYFFVATLEEIHLRGNSPERKFLRLHRNYDKYLMKYPILSQLGHFLKSDEVVRPT